MIEKLTIYYEHSACDIYYNNELKAVQTEWKGKFSTGPEFKLIHNRIIDLLVEKKTGTVIADARRMKIITPEDEHWIITDWYPRALKDGFAREILIVDPHSFSENSIRNIVRNYDHGKVETFYCTTMQEAVDVAKQPVM